MAINKDSYFEQAGIDISDSKKSTSEIFKASGLDWEVEQKNVYYYDNMNTSYTHKLPNLKANFRSDNKQFLGIVSDKTYKVVQNIEAFNFIDSLSNFTYDKVGSFKEGKKVFVIGKSTEQIEITKDDFVNFYLTFIHGHDGKTGIKFILSPIRMSCMNQMNLMLDKASFSYTMTHTGKVKEKITMVHKAIADSKKYVVALEDTIQNLINEKVSYPIEQFLNNLITVDDNASDLVVKRNTEMKEDIIKIYKEKDDLQNYKGTKFGIISAISDYISHKEPLRMTKDVINNTFISNIEGNQLLDSAYLMLAA